MIQNYLNPDIPLTEFWYEATFADEEDIPAQENQNLHRAQLLHWMIENRGGLAKIAGLLLLPAQIISNNCVSSKAIIDRLVNEGLVNCQLEKIAIPLGSGSIHGLICYPIDWRKEDNSRCVIYHNPNGIAMVSFFKGNRLTWSANKLMESKRCPLILYDYRGVGVNQDVISLSSLRLLATYETIVADGQAVIEYAFKQFRQIEVVGSSLGGAVATVGLHRHLIKTPSDISRIKTLVNHDSFTTSSRVILPNQHRLADFIGWSIGGNLDAATPMVNLINRNVKVLVLYRTKDPIIPFGARMGDFVQTLPKVPNVTVFASDSCGHGDLSSDMTAMLYDTV